MNFGDVAALSFAGLKRSLAETAFLKGRIGLPRPTAVRVTLTERCNYRCQYCWHWRQKAYRQELGLDDWKRIITDLRGYIGAFPIQFVGGEPMIWPGFGDLVHHCRNLGVRWGVITNGSALSPKLATQAVAARPSNIDISVDGSNGAIHDAARGVQGSHRHITKGLLRLQRERADTGQKFPIRIKTTVHRLNVKDLAELVEWVSGFSGVTIDFSPVRLWPSAERDKLYVRTSDDLSELEEMLRRLVSLKARGAPIETSVEKLLAMASHFRGERVFHGYGECRTALRTLDIAADGSAHHCHKFRIGSLLTHSIADLWESAERRLQIEQSLVCEMAGGNECGTACTAYRSLHQEARRAWLFLAKPR